MASWSANAWSASVHGIMPTEAEKCEDCIC